ncbi:MAG TPA: hypothetical protein VKT75_09010 [Acidobacteriaceae bacterium]|jgi:hypothetical protein|nr:hypothetical protein [Acidobacteriaceae bacterium]
MIRSPAIFVRVGSILPRVLHLKQTSFNKAWMVAEDAAPAQLDRAVRDAGWEFMWIHSACTRLGCGRTDEAATHRAIARALSQTGARFNAAELAAVRVSRYLGLRVAKATLHTRHISRMTG